MTNPIRFYLDFASPYAYFAAAQVEAIGEEFGREVKWRPILMWAVLKAQGIAAPMEAPVASAATASGVSFAPGVSAVISLAPPVKNSGAPASSVSI